MAPSLLSGLFTANGVSTISSGQEDAAAYGVNYNGITLTGSFTAPSVTTGIGTLQLRRCRHALQRATRRTYYYAIVSANEMLLLSSDTHATYGAALRRRTVAKARLPTARPALPATSDRLRVAGQRRQWLEQSYPAALNAILSDFAITGSGTATLAQDANRAGTFSSTAASPTAITYTTASNGRTAIVTGGTSNQVLYLYNTDTGFALDQAATTAYPALIQYQQQVVRRHRTQCCSPGRMQPALCPLPVPATDVSGIYHVCTQQRRRRFNHQRRFDDHAG
jgi:hypothetical protein